MSDHARKETMKFAIRASFQDCQELHGVIAKGPDEFYEYIISTPKETAAIMAAVFSELTMMFKAMGVDPDRALEQEKAGKDLTPAEIMMGLSRAMASGLMHRVALSRCGIPEPKESDRMDLCAAAMELSAE